MTSDDVAELSRLLSDPWWRLTNLYQILNEDGRVEPLRLRKEQEEYVTSRWYRNFIPKARKLGMSTIIVLLNGDACLFNGNYRAGIVDFRDEDATAKLQMFRFAWEAGPYHPDKRIATLWGYIHKARKLITDSGHEMGWDNGSTYKAGTSYVGQTPQALHVSEYGPLSAYYMARARQVKVQSINSVPPEGIIDIETTMEGPKFGPAYSFFKLALRSDPHNLTVADWKLHFFSWLHHPSYRLPGQKPTQTRTSRYFNKLKKEHGVEAPLERQAWYEKKAEEQGDDMYLQYPSVIEELTMVSVPGQIYPEITTLRSKGRVCEFEPEKAMPYYTAWDLGASDNTAGFLIQPAGKAHNILDLSSGEGAGAAGVAETIRRFEREHGITIELHFVPHDVKITDKGSGKTFLDQLVEHGIPRSRISVVPRIPDVWVGINEVRKILPNCWFHSRLDAEIGSEGEATAMERLESYRKRIDRSTGTTRSVPVHDACSHVADALRTYAEALSRGIVKPLSTPETIRQHGPAVVGGFRGSRKR